jgi:4-amino-4-deoxy-L-arabinose transferase-like glycosyltransferase
VSVCAAGAAVLATVHLGALLYGEALGLVAGAMLATTIGFVLEARTLRPDIVLLAVVVAAILCWQRALVADDRRTRWLVALYAALGLGVLAKGLVPVVLAGAPIGLGTLADGGWKAIRRLQPGLGLAVLAAIVLPWHVAMAWIHPGFAWDYVVNQHLLVLVDRKLPRDSEGDPLLFFWAAFTGRALPWIVLLPLTLAEASRGFRARAGDPARGTFVIWLWIGALLLFFSAAPSRLEHYSLPALPAVALLAARAWQRLRGGELAGRAWGSLAVVGAILVVAGTVLIGAGPALLDRTYWIAQAPGLLTLPMPAGAALMLGGALLVGAGLGHRATLVVVALAAAAVPLAAIVVRANVVVEPLFSWRPAAQAIRALPADAELVFEAPIEYQQVGGLAFYLGRPIAILEPPGFVPQTYLAPVMRDMFLSRAELSRRWGSAVRLVFVSDPQQRRDRPDGLVPGPMHVVARFGDRWVLANFAPR